MNTKPKIATVWLGGCSGCHMSFLDLDERLLDLAARADVVASPIMDTKEFPECDVVLIEGAVANADHVHHLRKIRERAKVLVSFGDCAVTGNVTSLRNGIPVQAVFDRAFLETAAVVIEPPRMGDGIMPVLVPKVLPLHHLVKIDYYMPGCPPPADVIWRFLDALIDGRAPDVGDATRRFG